MTEHAYWKSVHFIAFAIGGICYFVGSMMYFPEIADDWAGAILLIIGSFGYVVADAMDLVILVKESKEYFTLTAMLADHWKYGKKLVNYAFSFLGAFLFLVASILLLPDLDSLLTGALLFMIGAIICLISQCWKVRRAIVMEPNFHYVIMDGLSCFASMAYCIGGVLFLPEVDENATITIVSCVWLEIGSFAFVLSSFVLFVEYFLPEYHAVVDKDLLKKLYTEDFLHAL
jgi:hypothetical protein